MAALLQRPAAAPGPIAVQRYPISAEQRGMWFVQALAPQCGAYHIVFAFEAHRDKRWPCEPRGLLRELMAEYPVLRTSLPAGEGGAEQVVWDRVEPVVQANDARGLDEAALRERIRLDTRAPFDLAVPPLWRVHTYRIAEHGYVVAVAMHHALLDFWSLGLLLQSVSARVGLSEEVPATLDGAAFGTYAEQQGRMLSDPVLANAEVKHWKAHLDGAPPVHSLPLDHPRPAVQTYEGRSLRFGLPAATSEGIKRLAQACNATPFMALLAAYYVLLYRYSGETDIVVTTPTAGRSERFLRNALGQFVNTIALRARIDPAASFKDFLQAVKKDVVDGLRHQDCPFSLVVEQLAPQRDPSYSPIAQLGFFWERLPLMSSLAPFFLLVPGQEGFSAEGFTLKPYSVPQQEGQLDLTLEMGGEHRGEMVGVLKYHEHLFDEGTARGMVEAFIALVGDIVARPDAALADLELGRAASVQTWLARGAGATVALPEEDALQQIAAQARRTPQALAVSDATRQLSYRALMDCANHVASRLRALGVQRGDHVGLMLERSADLPVAILGIWASGAAYVPLDPAFPKDRLADMAQDAQLRALVSQDALSELWPADVPRVLLDALPSHFASAPEEDVAAGPLAYLIYTSGSTGKPKGVRIGHRSVTNFLQSMQDRLHLGAGTRLLAVTTPAFDISVLELLLPLLHGGTVVVCDRATTMDGAALAARIESERITMLQATPASWKLLLEAGWNGAAQLKALCGGEALAPALAEALLPRTRELWNVYGPTETTVWSSAGRVTDARDIHLGEPLHNTQLYVLDEQQRPVPPGVMGELWIGGDGLAVDYWQRPELSAAQFRRLPALPHAGRVYRTGDRVRYTARGTLVHHGRLDFQVKLRGYRIELGEIESVLRRQPGVDDVVVMVRDDRGGDPRLVAYLIADPACEPRLAPALRSILPGYMVPGAFVFLDSFPKTANNKINRKALPPPVLGAAGNLVAPRDPVEIALAHHFQDILGLEQVGIHDDFFQLGGHSLLAVKLSAAIGKSFGVEMPVSALAQHSTVAELAQVLRSKEDLKPSVLMTLRAGAPVQPLWLFHPIGGNIFCYLEMTRQMHKSRPVMAFQSPGLLAEDGADVAVEDMATRYRELLQQRQPSGPYLLGGWCFGGVIAFEVARQLRDAGHAVDGVVLIDTRAPVPANVPEDADDATLLSWFARDLAAPFGKTLTVTPDTLRSLPAHDMFDHVLSAARAIAVLPPDADRQELHRYFETYLANGIALQTYFPPADALPLLLLKAADEPQDYGPSLGWELLAEGRLQQVDLPGNHSSIMYAPQATRVAQEIDRHFPLQPLPSSTP